MAHELMQNGDGTYAYAGRFAAWHTLGEVRPNATKMIELFVASGLNTIVYELMPAFWEKTDINGDVWHHNTPNRKAMTINGNVFIDYVGEHYEFYQPSEVVDIIDGLLEAAPQWTPETCLALHDGRTTVYCVKMNSWNMTTNDKYTDFLIFVDTVDAKHSLELMVTPVCAVCSNTVKLARNKASVNLNIRHTTGHRDRFIEAINSITATQDNVHKALTELAEVQFNEDKLKDLYSKIFELPNAEDNKSKALRRKMGELQVIAYDNAMRRVLEQDMPFDGLTAYNGASETIEYGPFNRKGVAAKSYIESNGIAYTTLNRAYELVLEYK